MSSNAQTLQKGKVDKSGFLEKVKLHGELIAAIFSGVLIAIGWLLEKGSMNQLSIVSYILAFVIGGFAKAIENDEKGTRCLSLCPFLMVSVRTVLRA